VTDPEVSQSPPVPFSVALAFNNCPVISVVETGEARGVAMKRRWFLFARLITVLAACIAASAEAERDHLPRLSGAILLAGYPPSALWLTSGDQTLQLQREGWGDGNVVPSMSTDGRVVASGRYLGSDSPGFSALPRRWGTQPQIILSIWSAEEKQWTDSPDQELGFGGIRLTISHDGTQLALERAGTIQTFALKHGKVSPIAKYPVAAAYLSWSPDSKYLAFQQPFYRVINGVPVSLSTVCVLNLTDGSVRKIGEGKMPSWSSSGEWIAFYGYSSIRADPKHQDYSVAAERLVLIRPDGTGEKVIASEKGSAPPVWSPDSR
jgi:hypothetical protein